MTNTNDEERFIIDHLLSRRATVTRLEGEIRQLTNQLKLARLTEETTCQALIDFMKGNGLQQTQALGLSFTLGTSESIDCPDIAAVPEEYIRVKEPVREVNKAAIRAMKPQGNWWSVTTKDKLTIKEA